jgi:hypothetical protein
MIRGKWVLALVLMALAVGCTESTSTRTPVKDTPENRKVAAERYLKAVPPRDLLGNLAANMARRIPEPRRQLFMEAISDKELEQAASRIILTALVKHFTAQELNALTAFYSSPEGKSIRPKFGPYMADIMPQIGAEVRKVLLSKEEGTKPEAEKPGTVKGEPGKATPPKAAPAKPAQPQAAPPQPGTAPAEQPQSGQPQGK